MVKACLQLFRLVKPVDEESRVEKQIKRGEDSNTRTGTDSRRRKVVEATPTASWDLSFNSKDVSVRIVHAGGQRELYPSSVPASQVMNKYPGMCIAHPDVFKHPHESLICPDERLLPGHKYYLVPASTIEKLKRKLGDPDPLRKRRFPAKLKVKEIPPPTSDLRFRKKAKEEDGEDSFSSANEFYITGSTTFRLRTAKKPFVPPLPQSKIYQEINWEPSMNSVQEISP